MKGDDKEKKIFKAALKLFVENGIDHTSISSICKEAGISTGTPYLYFESKVDLINRLYLSIKKEILDVTATDLSASKLTYESFEKIWTEAVEWGVNNPYSFRFMTQMEASPYFNEDLEAQLANYEENQLNLIKEGTENSTFKKLPPEYISELIFTHVVYTINYISRTKTIERRIFFETLLNGIKY